MAEDNASNRIQSFDFAMPMTNYHTTPEPQDSSTSTSTTPTQEHTPSMMKSTSSSSADQCRGRPRYKRHQPSRRYFTPPSRIPSPARPDFMLEVETAPQDPDIFADAETDYFSSADRHDGPRAYRRHFFDAMPSIDGQTAQKMSVENSIAAQIAAK